jgi:hypothetical protein
MVRGVTVYYVFLNVVVVLMIVCVALRPSHDDLIARIGVISIIAARCWVFIFRDKYFANPRFRVRTLLIITTVCAVVLGAIVYLVRN